MRRIIQEDLIPIQEVLQGTFGSSEQRVHQYTRCPICASNLHFTYLADYAHGNTQEITNCPECGIKIRRVLHSIQ